RAFLRALAAREREPGEREDREERRCGAECLHGRSVARASRRLARESPRARISSRAPDSPRPPAPPMKTQTPKQPKAKKDTTTARPEPIDKDKAVATVERVWEKEILPTITEYIRIPNKSPHFDKDWQKSGHMKKAADLIEAWCKKRKLPGLKL